MPIELEVDSDSEKGAAKAILKPGCYKVDDIKNYVSYGSWFRIKFNAWFEKKNDSFYLDNSVVFGSRMPCPDFKVYYLLPDDSEPKPHSVNIKCIDENKTEVDSEVIKVYSNQSMSYFDDWLSLKIKSRPLIRLKNTTKIDDAILKKGMKSYNAQFDVFDISASKRREVAIFLFGLFLAAFLSMGLDATRIGSELFKVYFPESWYFSESAIWLLICLVAVPKFIIVRGSMKSNNMKWLRNCVVFSSVPVIFWAADALFVREPVLKILSESDLLFFISYEEAMGYYTFIPYFDFAFMFVSALVYTMFVKYDLAKIFKSLLNVGRAN